MGTLPSDWEQESSSPLPGQEIPFFNADNTIDNIALTALGEVPFLNADTTTDNIGLV